MTPKFRFRSASTGEIMDYDYFIAGNGEVFDDENFNVTGKIIPEMNTGIKDINGEEIYLNDEVMVTMFKGKRAGKIVHRDDGFFNVAYLHDSGSVSYDPLYDVHKRAELIK